MVVASRSLVLTLPEWVPLDDAEAWAPLADPATICPDTELVVVVCNSNIGASNGDVNFPPGLHGPCRVYVTASARVEDGETLGAWLAYGSTLHFARALDGAVPALAQDGIAKREYWTSGAWKALKPTWVSADFRAWKWACVGASRSPATPFLLYSIVYGYRGAILHDVGKYLALNGKPASDAIFFTDNDWPRKRNGWTVVYMYNVFRHQRGGATRDAAQTMSRFPKLCPGQVVPGFAASLYIDNNIRLHRPVGEVLVRFLKDKEWGVHKHGVRSCVYAEIQKCVKLGKDDPGPLNRQASAYRKAKMPAHGGIAENHCLARVHTPAVLRMCHVWWREYTRHSKRDQISFAFVAWKAGYWRHMNLVWPNLAKQPGHPDVLISKHAKSKADLAKRMVKGTAPRPMSRSVLRRVFG